MCEGFRVGVADEVQAVVIREKGFEFRGRGSFVGPEFPAAGVSEAEAPGVEHESAGCEGLTIRVSIDRVSQ